jgi:hypothetical protein
MPFSNRLVAWLVSFGCEDIFAGNASVFQLKYDDVSEEYGVRHKKAWFNVPLTLKV